MTTNDQASASLAENEAAAVLAALRHAGFSVKRDAAGYLVLRLRESSGDRHAARLIRRVAPQAESVARLLGG